MAIETSGLSASVAVFDRDQLLTAGETDPLVRTASGLAPLLRDVLSRTARTLRDVRLISLPVGPGSFTGLRVGVTTAKTLAYALGCDVLGLDTLEVIAMQTPSDVRAVWAVVDAQRQQLVARRFSLTDGVWAACGEAEIIDNDLFISKLATGDTITGSGLKRIVGKIPSGVTVVKEAQWMPRAETVGRLAYSKYQSGERGDLWQLVPQYFRPSAAEEKRALSH